MLEYIAIIASLAFLYSFFNHLKLKRIMASLQEFEQALSRIDAATTDIADDLRKLTEDLQNAGLPASVEADVLARLNAAADRLEAIGGNVANPDPVGDGTGTTEGGTPPAPNQ
jgi:hypothetical protein